jgi:small subunit ribosomal protein S13
LFNRHIPPRKTIKNALTSIYGIGAQRAKEISNFLCINPNNRFCALSAPQISNVCTHIASRYEVGAALRRGIDENIRRHVKIRSYRGTRHRSGLPLRGQRTHTNAQTARKAQSKGLVRPKA